VFVVRICHTRMNLDRCTVPRPPFQGGFTYQQYQIMRGQNPGLAAHELANQVRGASGKGLTFQMSRQ